MEAKRKNYTAIVEELKSQADLGLAMFKLKRMHMGFLTSRGRGEIKALYNKGKQKRVAPATVNS